MTLEQATDWAQIVGSIGVVVSFLFVGYQVRQSTAALVRGEHNSTMEQWTSIRMALASDRELSVLMTDGLSGSRPLDAADTLRLDMLINEFAWASFHIWDRTRRGVFPPGTFELSCGAYLGDVLRSPGGQAWWRTKAASYGLIPPFIADVDAMLAQHPATTEG